MTPALPGRLLPGLALAAGLLGALLAALGPAGCGPRPAAGWSPLWRSSWELVPVGELWLRGVPLAGSRAFDVAEPGPLRFRARLANRGRSPAEVVLDGPPGPRRWRLAPGEDRAVELALEPGSHRLEGGPGTVVGEPRLGLPLERPRLLVLVLADTLRADHVEPATTPGILAAFAGGRRWSDATANSPWTLPSVASLFTSRPVLELTTPEGGLIGLPRGVPTWAERLDEAGFAGGAAVANYTIHAQNGFARGFGSYRVPLAGDGPRQRDASWVVAEARRFLAAHRGEDAFLYLHFMDPHEPFRDHGRGLPRPPPMGPLGLGQRAATPAEAELIRTLYRGEVRHLDRFLGPWLAELPAAATVAFVADHGEALGEHGAWGHALTLYQEVVAVPLLLRGPGVPAGTADEPVDLVDLVPTLLELAGLAPAGGMAGRSLLAPRRSREPRRPIVTATFAAGPLRWAWRDRRRKAVLNTAPQPDAAAGGAALAQRDPLPPGFAVYPVPGDEEAAARPAAERVRDLARRFARTAGAMVPGPTLLLAGIEGPAEVAFDCPAELEPVQVWGTARVRVERDGGRWTIRTAQAYPLAGVAFRAAGEVRITPLAGPVPWPGRPAGRALRLGAGDEGVPAIDGPGAYLWWNGERRLEISGQRETEERLRALGYL
jgi:arylsulfatase A-like enzyme